MNNPKIPVLKIGGFKLDNCHLLYLKIDKDKIDKCGIANFSDLKVMYEKYEFTEDQKIQIKNLLHQQIFYSIIVDFVELTYKDLLANGMDDDFENIQKEVKERIKPYFPGPLVQIDGYDIKFIENNFETDNNIWVNPIYTAKRK